MERAFKALAISCLVVVVVADASAVGAQKRSGATVEPSSQDEKRLARFERQVDELRKLLQIPGVSVAIVKDQKLLWAKGLGFADLEKRVPATPDTVYSIASLTKLFAATLVMRLVEQGKLDLDEPVSHYSSDFKDDAVKIKHLLTHTSNGTPGERYQYDGSRFDYLTAVVEKKTGKSIREVFVATFLDPLAMSNSVPGPDTVEAAEKWRPLLGKENLDRYVTSLSNVAQTYTLYGDSETLRAPFPGKGYFGAAAGLLSTVVDLAKFDAAIDEHVFLKKETQELAWTPFVSNGGQRLPYGFGWFVTDYHGSMLVWHYGHWGTGFSSIYLKVPEKNLTLIVLANSEALADHQFQVGEDIASNAFACVFLRLFVFEDMQGRALPDTNWTRRMRELTREIERTGNKPAVPTGDCERDAQLALAKWRIDRRSSARKTIRLKPATLEAYVGKYQWEPPPVEFLTVTREGDRLFVDYPKSFKAELFAETETKFFIKFRPVDFTFKIEGGKVTGLEVAGHGQSYPLKRVESTQEK
jgi:CubicO group peptidase (beta-lactamase class C family)